MINPLKWCFPGHSILTPTPVMLQLLQMSLLILVGLAWNQGNQTHQIQQDPPAGRATRPSRFKLQLTSTLMRIHTAMCPRGQRASCRHTKVMMTSITAAPRATGKSRTANPICQTSKTSILQGQHKPHHLKHRSQRSLLNPFPSWSSRGGTPCSTPPRCKKHAKNRPGSGWTNSWLLLRLNPSNGITNHIET